MIKFRGAWKTSACQTPLLKAQWYSLAPRTLIYLYTKLEMFYSLRVYSLLLFFASFSLQELFITWEHCSLMTYFRFIITSFNKSQLFIQPYLPIRSSYLHISGENRNHKDFHLRYNHICNADCEAMHYNIEWRLNKELEFFFTFGTDGSALFCSDNRISALRVSLSASGTVSTWIFKMQPMNITQEIGR